MAAAEGCPTSVFLWIHSFTRGFRWLLVLDDEYEHEEEDEILFSLSQSSSFSSSFSYSYSVSVRHALSTMPYATRAHSTPHTSPATVHPSHSGAEHYPDKRYRRGHRQILQNSDSVPPLKQTCLQILFFEWFLSVDLK